eukprot:6202257-Pleurochrysis_carterae.AAC.2
MGSNAEALIAARTWSSTESAVAPPSANAAGFDTKRASLLGREAAGGDGEAADPEAAPVGAVPLDTAPSSADDPDGCTLERSACAEPGWLSAAVEKGSTASTATSAPREPSADCSGDSSTSSTCSTDRASLADEQRELVGAGCAGLEALPLSTGSVTTELLEAAASRAAGCSSFVDGRAETAEAAPSSAPSDENRSSGNTANWRNSPSQRSGLKYTPRKSPP